MYIARPCAHCSDNTDLGDMDDLGCSTPSSSTLSTHESSLSSSAELADVESDFTQPRAGEQQVFNMLDYLSGIRKWKIATNPPRGMKRSKGVTTNDSKSVCPSQSESLSK